EALRSGVWASLRYMSLVVGQLISDVERDDLHREVYRTQGKLTSCFG
ncbi:YD repeat-containing protein, partial [Pseudomonas amygdali pv. mori str. 301020]